MDKSKILAITKSLVIILIILGLAFLIRFDAHNLYDGLNAEQKAYFTDDTGLPYFSEMDSYYNLRMTQDFLDHGHFGDEIVNGTPWDSLSYAPEGRSAVYPPMIAYVTSFLHYLAEYFGEGMSIKEVAFFASTIIAPLCAIPAFIFVRRSTNDYGGIAAALLLVFSPNYFAHTFAGFFDTDMFTLIFPLLIVIFFIESIRTDKLAYRILFAILTVVSLGLFSLSWIGYMFYGAILVAAIVAFIILSFIFKVKLFSPFKEYSNKLQWFVNQRELFSIVLIAIVGLGVLTYFHGFDSVIESITGLFGSVNIQSSLSTVIDYPNVLISVGELQIPNFLDGGTTYAPFLASNNAVVNGVGGIIPFLAALAFVFFIMLRLYKLRVVKSLKLDKKPPKAQRKFKVNKSSNSFVNDFFNEKLGSIKEILKIKRIDLMYLSLFGAWILLAGFATTQGSRFIQMLVIPVTLCTGLFVGYATNYIKEKVDNNYLLWIVAVISVFLIALPLINLKLPIIGLLAPLQLLIIAAVVLIIITALIFSTKSDSKLTVAKKFAVVLVLTLAFVVPSVASAYNVSQNIVPGTSDPMWNSMTWVDKNEPNQTSIASWWDFGYVFELAGNRETVFDGGTQDTPRAFWIGKALTEDNDTLSAGILKMISTSGDVGLDFLDNYTNNTGQTVKILEDTLGTSKENAKSILMNKYKIPEPKTNEILNYSHPDKPRNVIFVMSSDMIGKSYWWSYFGSWDFDAKNSTGYRYMQAYSEKPLQGAGNTTIKYDASPNDPTAYVVRTHVSKGSANNSTNVSVDVAYKNDSKIILQNNNTTYDPIKLQRVIIIQDGMLMKNETVNKSGEYTIYLMDFNGSMMSLIMDSKLENSMFTKLYFLSGFGQDSFEFVDTNKTGGEVFLWRVKNSTNTATNT
ncbi:STT3 domain-containing protein [Methanobrevibacter filiformis]|uniref:dolichyl-phosphooligosaccharide-protein glycotransferase n=1 Tax=Methanobrevibacter filiformis TaxID=55758 RepID=A0A165ZEX1_9EURY|nr:STT3 domain-containing protein [Methanobrevibacter filiformis]KZX10623.1 oligosaccharyl transferase STT3 subunit [Methanobrevibacter filiformis]